ncbi:uncharacterized protein LOC135949214 [Calliphora vicina]|uniref:uncharacterized protein LOC135949214 n=1 Tax=Calliphora vicina TaxID=7373 RepID=UPI00325B6B43
MVRDKDNVLQSCRALIDSGAQSTLVSEACVQRLHLNRTNDKTLIYGVGDSNTNYTRGRVQLEIFAPGTKGTIIVQTYCLSNLTQYLPSHTVDNNDLQFFNNLHLADPEYFKKNKIDIIIGADVFAHCILEGKVTHPSGSPIALNTIFGWIIMGNVNEVQQSTFVAHIYSDLDMQLQKFWDTGYCQHPTKHLSQEEEMAERHYTENVERQEDGKYMVRLPFKSSPVELGESKCSALKRLESMERKFARNPEHKEEFHKFMEEYERLEHMQLAPNGEKQAYYMPHHAVLKPSSTTTKLRVVFDASCKTSNNLSLNDQLLVGPTVQNDLYTILLKFRKFEIGFTADIGKMYRQVTIHPADRQFQTILWRNSPDEATREYQLTTVTYGTSAAPFLATRTLQQVAIDNSTEYPTESHEIINNFYVDDYMSSSPDLESANSLRITLCSILSKSGFNLRKWSSNSQQFRENIEPVDRAFSSDTIIDCSETVKTLGLLWNTTTDFFQYSVSLMESSDKITKRHILSEISKIYDPIGWLAPMDGSTATSLLTAKTRVAPIKQITLPRLELCGAQLMVKLMIKVKVALNLKDVNIHGWTDSTVVLAWISDHSRRWKTFVANRTSYIVDNLPASNWHHIASKLNPADLATRGISSTDLINNTLWWKGPNMLQNYTNQPHSVHQISEAVLREEKKTMIATATSHVINDIDLIDRYSSFTRLIRITARILRFMHNCTSRKTNLERKSQLRNLKQREDH